ncbi:mandelate racemase/muconate lactonizing enzyme family protein [Bosea sp. BK604]|uniref:mandelate racemase/muconate lactonizing enzyme family protein n=1 Tax=Bosea sp. BK604 TaxID=2512180 RepID=UPI001049DDB1|nr:mandelate racemase/muconate lactonizing enzyme family protein [Bosea sp. BK604]TCR70047.1 galactonate dehydratase [Bosea sp. BK604]
MTISADDPILRVRLQLARISPKTVWAFLRVGYASGIEGIGEASLNGRERALIDVATQHLPRWIERGVGDEPLAGLALPVAALRTAFDVACQDAAARRAGTTLAVMLGGNGAAAIPLYANINRRTADRSPEGFAASAAHAVARGFEAFKIAPFDEVTRERCAAGEGRAAMQAGLARIAATREAIGPQRRLMVDCHWRFDEAMASELVEAVAPFGLHWLECPILENQDTMPALRALRSRLNARGTRLAGLEEFVGAEAFLAFARAGAYDVMMPDMKYVGGVDEMLRTAEALQALGVEVSPHNPTGPICHAASLQVCAALPGFTMLEMQLDETPLFWELATPALPDVAGGRSAVPGGSGLGVALDDARLAALLCVDLTIPVFAAA